MSLVDFMAQFLHLSALKHQVLSDNIANANTPAYKAKTVNLPQSFDELIKIYSARDRLSLTTTSDNHLPGSNSPNEHFRVEYDSNSELKPNGNNVHLDMQAMEVNKNQIYFEKILKGYKELYSLLNMAVNGDIKV